MKWPGWGAGGDINASHHSVKVDERMVVFSLVLAVDHNRGR